MGDCDCQDGNNRQELLLPVTANVSSKPSYNCLEMGWTFVAVVVLFSIVATTLKKLGVVGDRWIMTSGLSLGSLCWIDYGFNPSLAFRNADKA